MNRRDVLKWSGITAVMSAVGIKPKAAGPKMEFGGFISGAETGGLDFENVTFVFTGLQLEEVVWHPHQGFGFAYWASVFVDDRKLGHCYRASEKYGWAEYLERDCSPFDLGPGHSIKLDKDKTDVIEKRIYGNVRIEFENPEARALLLKKQEERNNTRCWKRKQRE